MLTVAQVKAVELAFYLKGYGAAQARTGMISHQNSFHGLWGRDVTRSFAACRSASEGASANSHWLCDLSLLWQALELWHVTNRRVPNRSARCEDVRSWQHRDFSIQTPCGNNEQVCKLGAW